MKQTLLGKPKEIFKRELKKEVFVCCIACVLAVGVNVLLCFLRTDANHDLLLACNILLDVLCGWGVIYRIETAVLIKKRLLTLASRPLQKYDAVTQEVEGPWHRIPGLDCREVIAGGRILYLPLDGKIQLCKDVSYTFRIAGNVIVEVEA